MAYYKDLRAFIQTLEKQDKLFRIKRPVNIDTELMPLVRWEFRGLPEEQRRAFLFEDVVDTRGRRYNIPVLVGGLAACTEIYALGMMCPPAEIRNKWLQALREPRPPRLVPDGPVQEEILVGKALVEEGLDRFPFTIDIPGFDGMRRVTADNFFTKDPETGVVNIGCYSALVQARDRMVIAIAAGQHIGTHLEKSRKLGKPLQAALVVGVVPVVSFVSVAKVPYGQDELAVAGGIAGEGLKVVKCQTVALEVPAAAEIVIEGEVSTEYSESLTGSFGEYSGYMAETFYTAVFNITCITHRKNPIFTNLISQMPPSEGSKIRQIAYDATLLEFLKDRCNLPNVLDTAFYETSGAWQFCVIQMRKTHDAQAWQALYAAANFAPNIGKFYIAVDEDIDLRDPESVIWAMSFRAQPHRDTRITTGKIGVLDHSTAPPGSPIEQREYPPPTGASTLLIDATRKWGYPPVALPKREYMEKAKKIWEAEGLPPLKPRTPWYGYELGYWPENYAQAAEMNLQGRVYELGEKARRERKPYIPR